MKAMETLEAGRRLAITAVELAISQENAHKLKNEHATTVALKTTSRAIAQRARTMVVKHKPGEGRKTKYKTAVFGDRKWELIFFFYSRDDDDDDISTFPHPTCLLVCSTFLG